MAHEDRITASDLVGPMLADARNYDFFRLMDQLHRIHADDLEGRDRLRPARQRVRLSAHAGLSFPASDVADARCLPTEASSEYLVQTTFFGLHGTDSPLPGYYLDKLAYEAGQGTGIRPAFLDFVNHRVLTLLHHAWRKYRYFVRFQQNAQDHFSKYVFALIGLGDDDLRGETPIAWSRLLSFAGLVAGRGRSPTMVAGIIAHCFDLPSVQIRQFERSYTSVPTDQRNAVGRRNCTLARDFVLGRRARTVQSKFTISITDLSQARFRDFLPTGADHPRLCKLVDFLLRDPHAYDLELGLRRDEVKPLNVAHGQGSHLGWTSFLRQPGRRPPPLIRIKVRK